MVEYFAIEGVPGKAYFRCERQRATLSTDACAGSWRRADVATDGTCSACRLCPIGAVHAGEVAASMSPLKGSLTCARCHRPATRLIGKMVCVSCKNREYELLRGRNAKGTAPVKTCRLDPRMIRFDAGGDLRYLRVQHSIDTDELVVATLRDSRSHVVFGYNPTPPAAVRQARLW